MTAQDRIPESAARRRLAELGYQVEQLPDGRVTVSGAGWAVTVRRAAPLLTRLARVGT